uniref:cullin-RING-type E3 NEDD8 transferase n=1 Tax=Bubo bubo TaxID=30461 RepID=A0A8C0IDV3_BUBBB
APIILVDFLLCVVRAHTSMAAHSLYFPLTNLFLRWNPENQIESCSCLLLDACLRCQAENKQEDCVVVWGECNHSFHNCCMSLWVKQNNRCPLCQQDWVVQRIGK